MKISPSLIQTWMKCPLQARFKEIEGRPGLQNAKTTFGTCMHDALEMYNLTGDYDLARERFLGTWEYPEILNAVPDYWPKMNSYGSLRKRGLDILETYHGKTKWNKREVISTEHKFCVPFGEHELSGIVDLIEVRKVGKKQTLGVVDYKTSSWKPTLDALRMNVQFTVYWFATLQPEFWMGYDDDKYQGLPNGEELYHRFADMERQSIWYHLWENKEINAGNRDDDDFQRLYRCVCEIANAIDKSVYVPNISGESCTFCDYKDICKVVIPISAKLGSSSDDIYVSQLGEN